MTIEISDDVLNQTTSKANRDSYDTFINDNKKSFSEFRKEIANTDQAFQDLVITANKYGIDIEWDDQGRLTKKCREELEVLNVKYAEGTTASKLYARAQELEAQATELANQKLREKNGLINLRTGSSTPTPKKVVTAAPTTSTATTADTTAVQQNTVALSQNAIANQKLSAQNIKNATTRRLKSVSVKTDTAEVQKNSVAANANVAKLNMQSGALKLGAAAANMGAKAMRLFGFESAAAMVKALGPMVALTAALAGIQWAISKVSDNIPTLSNLKNWAEESKQAFEEAKGNVESLKSELQTVKDRIDELNGAGPLSFTEQSELERLKKQSAELEKQLSIQRAIANEKEREATEDAYKVLEKQNEAPGGPNATDYLLSNEYYDTSHSWLGNELNIKIQEYKQAAEELENLDVDPYDDKSREEWQKKKSEVDEYKTAVIEAFEEIEDIDDINPELLDEGQLRLYEEIMGLRNEFYVSTGDLSMDTAMQSVLDPAEYDAVVSKMQELADSEKQIDENSIKAIFSEDALQQLKVAGVDIQSIIEHIQNLRGVGGALDSAISGSSNEDEVRSNIDEMISEKDFDINTEAVQKALGDDIIKACEKAGYSIDDLIEHFKKLQEEGSKSTFKGAIDDIKSMSDALDPLSSALQEFRESGQVSIDALSGLADSVFASTEGFDEFIEVISNSNSTMEEVESSAGRLVEAYFNQEGILKNLTAENAALYEQELKRLGVENANEIVQYNLAKATLTAANATHAAKEAAWEQMQALGMANGALSANAMAALSAGDMNGYFAAQQALAAGNNFAEVVSSHASALLAVANAAGPAASNLAEYASIALQLANLQAQALNTKSPGKLLGIGGQIAALVGKSALLQRKAYDEFINISKPSFQFGGGYSGSGGGGGSSGGGGGGGSGTKASDKRRDQYSEAKEKLDHQLEMNKISYDKYYKELVKIGNKFLKNQKGNLDDYRGHLETLASVRRDAFDKLRDEQDKKLEDGKISIDTYYKNVVKLEKKWLDGRDATAEDYAEAIEERIERIADFYKEKYDKLKDWIETQDLYQTWAPGKNEVQAIEDFIKELKNQLRKGIINWETYYELVSEAQKDLLEAQTEEYETHTENINDLIDLVSDMLKQEKEDMIDALNEQLDRYREICEAKKEAIDLTRAELDYQRELEDANKELSELQAKAAVLKLDTSREGQTKYKALMEEIAQKQLEISDKQDDHAYDATIEGIDKALEKYEEKIGDRIEDIQETMENQGEWLKYVYSYINNTDPSKLLDKLIAYNDKYGTGIAADVNDIWKNYQEVIGNYQGKQIEEIINLLRQQLDAAQNGGSSEGEDGENGSENYQTIGSMIAKMKENSEAMKGLDKESKEYKRLFNENVELAKKIEDESTGEYDGLVYNPETGKWTTKTGTDLYKKISSKGRTAVTIKNEMAKAKTAEERNALAAELREIAGYEKVFYDHETKQWYKNAADYAAQKPLFEEQTVSALNTVEDFKKAMRNEKNNPRTLRQLAEAIHKMKGYENTFYDANTGEIFKTGLGFSTGTTILGDKLGKAPASRFIKTMDMNNSAKINNLIVPYLRKIKGYEGVYYDQKKKKWFKNKNSKTPLYHTGLEAGFVGGDYSPTPKQNELYALLQKGELVLNKSDQDRLAVQMQVLSTLTDSLRKAGNASPTDITNNAGDIIVQVEAPLIINGTADESTIKMIEKHGDIIADKTLSKLTDALTSKGLMSRVRNNARKQ